MVTMKMAAAATEMGDLPAVTPKSSLARFATVRAASCILRGKESLLQNRLIKSEVEIMSRFVSSACRMSL